jgi:hypothetical protein
LALDITVCWAVALWIIGHQVFTQRSITRSAIVIFAPIVVIVVISVILAGL